LEIKTLHTHSTALHHHFRLHEPPALEPRGLKTYSPSAESDSLSASIRHLHLPPVTCAAMIVPTSRA
jgi:hypothetical protein